MNKQINRQELINYKNKLKEDAEQYYEWASINEDKAEESKELAISEKLNKIADDLEKMIYD